PKISAPGSAKFPTNGPHNTNVGRRGQSSALAPKPSGGANILGNDKPSLPQNGPARIGTQPASPAGVSGPAGSFTPVKKPVSGLANQRIGQKNPETAAAATKKPKRKGIGAAFYGEY